MTAWSRWATGYESDVSGDWCCTTGHTHQRIPGDSSPGPRAGGEPPVRGVCRWCGEHTAAIHLTWHDYCLDAYRVASGQKPGGIQVTMCEGCGGPAAELDHRLAINVARAMGPEALRRAVHAGEPAVALQLVPPAQDQAGPTAGEVPSGLLAGLARSPEGLERQPRLGGRVPCSAGDSRRRRARCTHRGRPHRGIEGTGRSDTARAGQKWPGLRFPGLTGVLGWGGPEKDAL